MVYSSDYALEYPKDATISNILLDYNIGGVSANSPSIIDGPTGEIVYTYSSLRLAVRRLATYLQHDLGIGKGTVVCVLAFNTVRNYSLVSIVSLINYVRFTIRFMYIQFWPLEVWFLA